MKPALVQFEQEYKGKITVIRVNTRDTNSDDYRKYSSLKARGIPYTILLDADGKVQKTKLGLMSLEELRAFAGP